MLNIRNPILVSYVAKGSSGLLPYHGLSSGIRRALAAWPEIDLVSDHEACLFTATVHRHAQINVSGKRSGKASGKILAAVRQNARITLPELASEIGITERSVEKNIQKLQDEGLLRRIGAAKGGHWEIAEIPLFSGP